MFCARLFIAIKCNIAFDLDASSEFTLFSFRRKIVVLCRIDIQRIELLKLYNLGVVGEWACQKVSLYLC